MAFVWSVVAGWAVSSAFAPSLYIPTPKWVVVAEILGDFCWGRGRKGSIAYRSTDRVRASTPRSVKKRATGTAWAMAHRILGNSVWRPEERRAWRRQV